MIVILGSFISNTPGKVTIGKTAKIKSGEGRNDKDLVLDLVKVKSKEKLKNPFIGIGIGLGGVNRNIQYNGSFVVLSQ